MRICDSFTIGDTKVSLCEAKNRRFYIKTWYSQADQSLEGQAWIIGLKEHFQQRLGEGKTENTGNEFGRGAFCSTKIGDLIFAEGLGHYKVGTRQLTWLQIRGIWKEIKARLSATLG